MPCCLVFSIVILRFSAIRNLFLSDSVSLFKFPLIRKKATCQGRNEVYGIRDQRPKKDRDQGT